MNKVKRIERHVRLAMENHLGDDDFVKSAVFGHGSVQKNGEAENEFFGTSGDMYMVVTNRRVYLVELGEPFPAKKDAAVEPALMISNRVQMIDETIYFPRSFSDLDTVAGHTTNTQVNEWLFHPARLGWTFE